MKEEINVEEIWQSVLHSYDMYIDYDVRGHSAIITAMKILANKVLDLAAENAKTKETTVGFYTSERNIQVVDRDSILQIKDWIK